MRCIGGVSYLTFPRIRGGDPRVADALSDCLQLFPAYAGLSLNITKRGAVKKSATKPVDFLDMEAHGL